LDLAGDFGVGNPPFPFVEVEPGKYVAEIFSPPKGIHLLRMIQKRGGPSLGEATIVVSYSPEYLPGPPIPSFLSGLAAVGRGCFFRDRVPAAPEAKEPSPQKGGVSFALILAALLFFLDQGLPILIPNRNRKRNVIFSASKRE
jgi:hypothetical protein